ncbi:hypothetical protein CLOM621_06586 [Clostridium sp. M62/1]|nr:hypothetical protein CLOM621_06586 [Clostridium sp. M62/1]
MIQERILLCRILRLRRVAEATFSFPPQCDPSGAFLYSRERSFLLYKRQPVWTADMFSGSLSRHNSILRISVFLSSPAVSGF